MFEEKDDTLTVAAVAVLAFMLADAGHEVVGHGIGFYLAGGRSGIFTTTRLIETQRLGDRGGDVFDLGGPAGNLACASAAWLIQHLLQKPAPRLSLLLWLAMAFNLFWAFGYLLFSGAFAEGDWLALVRGWPHLWIGRIILIVAGFLLYHLSLRLVIAELNFLNPVRSSVRHLVLTAYLAGGFIACAGAAFDPRGLFEILNSGALSSVGAAIGLLAVPRFLPKVTNLTSAAISRSYVWVVLATVTGLFYVLLLGPGIRFTL